MNPRGSDQQRLFLGLLLHGGSIRDVCVNLLRSDWLSRAGAADAARLLSNRVRGWKARRWAASCRCRLVINRSICSDAQSEQLDRLKNLNNNNNKLTSDLRETNQAKPSVCFQLNTFKDVIQELEQNDFNNNKQVQTFHI